MARKDLQKRKEYAREYAISHKDFVNGLSAKWRKNNPEKAKEIQKKYRAVNKEKVRASKKKWATAHPEEQRIAIKNWRLANNGKIREYSRKRRNSKFYASGSHSAGEWETLKAQYNWTCPSCKESEPEIKLTEDHIVPLSKGGSDNIENIQPLCGSCNCKKHTSTIKYD